MERSLVVAREQSERLGLEHRPLEVLAGERANGIDRVEPRQRDERDLGSVGSAQQLGAAESGISRIDGNRLPSRKRS